QGEAPGLLRAAPVRFRTHGTREPARRLSLARKGTMGIHLLVVGCHRYQAPRIDDVYTHAVNWQTLTFKVERCSSPMQLVRKVRKVALDNGAMIDILDLYDHGGSGHILMGDDVLFDDRGVGLPVARALRPLLTPDARVRLLGCDIATFTE